MPLRGTHSLAVHFAVVATFAGRYFGAVEPVVELQQAKHKMKTGAGRQGKEDEERERGVGRSGRLLRLDRHARDCGGTGMSHQRQDADANVP